MSEGRETEERPERVIVEREIRGEGRPRTWTRREEAVRVTLKGESREEMVLLLRGGG